MSEPKDLLALLQTLAKTHSPSSKLRMLANSWRILRNLTPKQQQNLFAAQGLKQASTLLRRAGGWDERSRDLLLALADRADKADSVDKLTNIFRRFRKGEVSEMLDEGLDHLEDQIRGSREEQEKDEQPPLNVDPLPLDLEPQAKAERPPAPPSRRARTRASRERETREREARDREAREREAAEEASRRQATSQPVDDGADTGPAVPQAPGSAPDQARSTAEVRTQRVIDQDQAVREEREDPWPAPPVETTRLREPESILARLSGESTLLDRFRLVRDRFAELSNSTDLAQAVEQFPAGWARRRFVTQLIRKGDLDFEQACGLLERLPGSGENWAVSAILERFPIDASRLSILEEVVRSPLSKRRVKRHRV